MDASVLRTRSLGLRFKRNGKRWPRTFDFDGSDFYPKYENFLWTQEFPLEKIYISEFGLRVITRKGDFIRTGYYNIVCAPLPGVAAQAVTADYPDDEYERAAKKIRRYTPVTPLLVLLTALTTPIIKDRDSL